jgi:hypothetical protein
MPHAEIMSGPLAWLSWLFLSGKPAIRTAVRKTSGNCQARVAPARHPMRHREEGGAPTFSNLMATRPSRQ